MDRQLTQAGKTLLYREPEGMSIHLPNASNPGAAWLCMGFASYTSSTDTNKQASIYYKDALI